MSLARHYYCADVIDKKFDQYTLLDVGCGSKLLKYRLKNCTNYQGIDQEQHDDDVILCDLENSSLPYEDNSFDVVTALDVLEHLENPDQVLSEIIRVSKKMSVISLPNMYYYKFRLNFLFGRGISDKYRFNLVNKTSRHKWLPSYEETIDFVSSKTSKSFICYDIFPLRNKLKLLTVLEKKLGYFFPNTYNYGSIFFIDPNKEKKNVILKKNRDLEINHIDKDDNSENVSKYSNLNFEVNERIIKPNLKNFFTISRDVNEITINRSLQYLVLKKIVFEGKLLDFGGGDKSLYKNFLQSEDYYSLNIDEKIKPTFNIKINEKFKFNDKYFNNVLSMNTFEHIYDHDFVLKEMYRVLKDNSKLYIITPFLFPIHGHPDDFLRPTPSYYTKKLKTHGFNNVTIYPLFWGPLSTGIACSALSGRGPIKKLLSRICLLFDIFYEKLRNKKNNYIFNYPLSYLVIAEKKLIQ